MRKRLKREWNWTMCLGRVRYGQLCISDTSASCSVTTISTRSGWVGQAARIEDLKMCLKFHSVTREFDSTRKC